MENSGGIIKKWATFLCWLTILICLVSGCLIIISAFNARGNFNVTVGLPGILIIVVGIIVAILVKAFISAYGEITDNTHRMVALLESMEEKMGKTGTIAAPAAVPTYAPAAPASAPTAAAPAPAAPAKTPAPAPIPAAAPEEAKSEEMIFCTKCGTKNKADMKFCTQCGANLWE